jgi:monoamine oxidase
MSHVKYSKRSFGKIGLGLLSSIMAGNAFASLKQDLEGKKITVIGAGISGLTAANVLRNRGGEVTVLEAKNHVGGRIQTDWNLGAPFELGAGWIHGPSAENPVRSLADKVDSTFFITDDEAIEIYDVTGDEMDEDESDEIEEIWYEVLEEMDADSEGSILKILNEYDDEIWENPNVRWIFSAYTEFEYGGSINDISAGLIHEMSGYSGDDVIITSGYDKIIKILAQHLDIRINSPVRSVSYGYSDHVTVETKGETFTSDYVICSVPLGVLKNDSITFSPNLPPYMKTSINKVGFGTVTKLAIKFTSQFWDSDVQYYGTVNENTGRWPLWLNYKTFSDENILMGFCFGDYALTADRMSDQELLNDALEVINNIWEDDVTDVQAILRTSWLKDPFSLGAYSFPASQNTEEDFENLFEPQNERLFFCGEHTNLLYLATTHGALLSGIRAANQIIDFN